MQAQIEGEAHINKEKKAQRTLMTAATDITLLKCIVPHKPWAQSRGKLTKFWEGVTAQCAEALKTNINIKTVRSRYEAMIKTEDVTTYTVPRYTSKAEKDELFTLIIETKESIADYDKQEADAQQRRLMRQQYGDDFMKV